MTYYNYTHSSYRFSFAKLDERLSDTLYTMFIEYMTLFYRNSEFDISRTMLCKLLQSFQETIFMRAFNVEATETMLFDRINDFLLSTNQMHTYIYYDVDSQDVCSQARINMLYKHETSCVKFDFDEYDIFLIDESIEHEFNESITALYNLNAYINQYFDYFSMI